MSRSCALHHTLNDLMNEVTLKYLDTCFMHGNVSSSSKNYDCVGFLFLQS